MGKHKQTQCPIEGCSYKGRSNNMIRHLKSHERATLKHAPSIFKPKPERLKFKKGRRPQSDRAAQVQKLQMRQARGIQARSMVTRSIARGNFNALNSSQSPSEDDGTISLQYKNEKSFIPSSGSAASQKSSSSLISVPQHSQSVSNLQQIILTQSPPQKLGFIEEAEDFSRLIGLKS